MTHYAQRIVTFLGAALFSIVALSAGSPFDRDLIVSPSEEAIAHYVSSCSTVTTPGLRVCQEQPLDFNNDGDTDMIVGIGISSPARNKFYAGRGNGLFSSAVFFGPQTSTSGLKLADLDGDGDLDMVESTRGGVNNIYVNDGSNIGSFDTAQAIDARTERSSSVAVGDVDNDGLLDIVIGNEGSGGLQSNLVYLNTTTTPDTITFDAAIELDAPGSESWTRRLVLLDAEGDGDLDVVATSASGQADGLGTGNVLYINRTVDGGPGLFDAAIALAATAVDDTDEANAVAAGDIDNDGDPDLVFSVWKGPDRYYINNSTGAGPDFETTGTFGPSDAGSLSSQSSNVRLGDLDNDNDLDAAITTFQGDNRIHLNLHDSGGGPGFAAALTIVDPDGLAVDESRGIDMADLNGDGSLDLLILNRDQLDLRYLNNDTCAGGGNACNPFDNDGPEILSQLATVFIDEDLPFDLLTELDQLEVQDTDNVFPADFGVVLSTPVGNDEYTCPPNSNGDPFTCEGSVITPNPGYSGPLTVDMKVNDGENTSASFVFNIDVNSLEDAPEFTSVPVTTASESLAYTYNITAEDGDGDAITIDANPDPVPAWLVLTDNLDGTATLAGTPGPADVGDHNITLRVRDPDGDFGTQVFTITVEAGAPMFTSVPLTAAAEGELYSYVIAASDPDAGDTLTITSATPLPGLWLTLTDNGDGTALLEGTPTGLDVGPNDIELLVEDQGGLSDTQVFTITVTAAGEGPTITL
ncbi:MAG: FG-GAP-like repeat-containing protein, partial [Gemmatimonadota bacterium]|nr:FG-GAP-like repeat-containing protein [Gemmatimonadota bacterium]